MSLLLVTYLFAVYGVIAIDDNYDNQVNHNHTDGDVISPIEEARVHDQLLEEAMTNDEIYRLDDQMHQQSKAKYRQDMYRLMMLEFVCFIVLVYCIWRRFNRYTLHAVPTNIDRGNYSKGDDVILTYPTKTILPRGDNQSSVLLHLKEHLGELDGV